MSKRDDNERGRWLLIFMVMWIVLMIIVIYRGWKGGDKIAVSRTVHTQARDSNKANEGYRFILTKYEYIQEPNTMAYDIEF
jgi:hypothetical protein